MLSLSYESKNADSSRRHPRHIRIGGFIMSHATAAAWASQSSGRDLHPSRNAGSIIQILREKVRPYRANFGEVGEVRGVNCMVMTQSARFQGYKDLDPSLIIQFEEGEREAIARKLLEEEGITDYEFTTVLA